jgi:hypothetical protein
MISLPPGTGTLFGKPVADAPATPSIPLPRAATAPTVARPVLPVEAALRSGEPRGGSSDATVAAARRTLAVAVRSNAVKPEPVPAGREADAPARPAPTAPASLWREELLARIARPGGLPLLPEPASPARSAFAEAVLALRSGIGRDGAADRPAGGG